MFISFNVPFTQSGLQDAVEDQAEEEEEQQREVDKKKKRSHSIKSGTIAKL